jgi:O-antigen/teichoic acid export membrane protein
MNLGKALKGLFVKNTFFGVAQQTVTMVTTFFLLPYMVWRMGAEGYGYWMILQIFSVAGYLSLAEMGFQGSVVRYLSRFHAEENTEDFRKLFVSSLLLFLAIGVLLCAAVLLFDRYLFLRIFSIPQEHARVMQAGLAVYGVSFLFQLPSMMLKAFYISVHDFLRLKLWETLNVLLFAAAIVVLMFYNTSVFWVVAIETAVNCCLFAAFFILPLRRYRELYALNPRHFSIRSLKNITGMTFYMFFFRVFGLVFNRTPQIFIAYFLTPAFMTYYAIISKIPRAMKQMQGMLNTAVVPLATSLDALREDEKMKRLFLRGTRYSFLFLSPVAVFAVLYAGEILRVWMGADYVFLANYLRLYVVWQYLNFLVSFGTSMYTRTEHFRYMTPFYTAGVTVFLLFMGVFIERYELWAVLGGMLLSSCITIPSSMILIYRINRFTFGEFFNYILKGSVIAGTAFCLAILLVIKVFLPIDSIALLVAYGGVMYLIYMALYYRFGLFDFEKDDIGLLLKKT